MITDKTKVEIGMCFEWDDDTVSECVGNNRFRYHHESEPHHSWIEISWIEIGMTVREVKRISGSVKRVFWAKEERVRKILKMVK